MEWLAQIFSHVCGQVHLLAPGGELLPFCQRCTGLYVGGALAFVFYALFRPLPTPRVLWIHGLLLLQMIPFGYHLVPQDGTIRTVTGRLFAFGLTYFLALNPGAQLGIWEKRGRQSMLAHACAALATILALELAVHWGGAAAGFVLGWVGFLGLLVYGTLVLANLVALPLAFRSLFRRPQGV